MFIAFIATQKLSMIIILPIDYSFFFKYMYKIMMYSLDVAPSFGIKMTMNDSYLLSLYLLLLAQMHTWDLRLQLCMILMAHSVLQMSGHSYK